MERLLRLSKQARAARPGNSFSEFEETVNVLVSLLAPSRFSAEVKSCLSSRSAEHFSEVSSCTASPASSRVQCISAKV